MRSSLPTIRSQLPMFTSVWRRADYLFGGGRTSVGATAHNSLDMDARYVRCLVGRRGR